eukprot:7482940-Heterocapsa_arctica.AAC.1
MEVKKGIIPEGDGTKRRRHIYAKKETTEDNTLEAEFKQLFMLTTQLPLRKIIQKVLLSRRI